MSKIIYVSLILLVLYPFKLFATTDPLPEASLKTLPLILHHDAKEFYSTVNPVLERKKSTYTPQVTINPYELYFDAVIFGNIFDLKTVGITNNDIDSSITRISNQTDAMNSRGYLINSQT